MIEKIANGMDEIARDLRDTILEFIKQCGSIVVFLYDSSRLAFRRPNRYLEIVRHMEFVGNQSILIIMLTGAFTGLALAYQIYMGFKMVNATNLVGPIVALGISRELDRVGSRGRCYGCTFGDHARE